MLAKEQVKTKDYEGHASTPKTNFLYGNQNGYMPEIGALAVDGTVFEAWGNNSAYVTSNIIAVPLSTPAFLGEFKGQEAELRKMWIDLMTVLPTTIEGLEGTLSTESDEHQVGASGNLFMQETTKITKSRSNIVNTYLERVGKPINSFLEFLIRWGEGDEYSQAPLVSTMINVRTKFKSNVRLQPYYSGSIMYIELDKMNVNVVNAWLAVGVRPESGGEVTGKRDLASGGEIKRYTINIKAMVDTNEVTKAHAQLIVDNMSIFKVNPGRNMIIPVDETTQNIHTSGLSDTSSQGAGFNKEDFKVPAAKTGDGIDAVYGKA